MHRSNLWGAVHPMRAVLEAVLLTAALWGGLLLLAPPPLLAAMAPLVWGLLGVLLSVLRARLSDRPWRSALPVDAGLAVLLMLGLGLAWSLLLTLFAPLFAPFERQIQFFLIVAAGFSAVNFFLARLALRLWRVWQVARQQRLLWAMLHAHLLTVLALLSLYLLIQAGRSFWSEPLLGSLPATGPAGAFLRLSTVLFELMGTAILAIPLLAGVLGLAALMSYLTTRPITRRLEALAQAVADFRQGHELPDLTIEGHDEVAQLSADFKAMAADLQQTLTDLQAERDTVTGLLRSRRELIATVSHELRTPVATVHSYLESILDHWTTPPPPHLRQDLDVIQREIIRLQTLIDDLFILSRAEVGQLTLRRTAVEVGPLIRQVVETVALLAWQSSRVQVVADIPTQLPPALADSGRLAQILYNLVHNALRHTPPGGIIAVAARFDAEQILIEVKDTGSGIPAANLPHIWTRFHRDPITGGAGLGLALVKELITAMDGRITVESEVGRGTCFTLHLPPAKDL